MPYRRDVKTTRFQKFGIILIALALAVPVGALGVSQLMGPDSAEMAAVEDNRPTVNPADQPQPTATTAPDVPAVMTEQTAEGASATLDYLLASYPYMMATGDTSVWQPYVSPTCTVCTAFITNAQDLQAMGGWFVGGEFTLHGTTFYGQGEPPTAGTAVAPFSQGAAFLIDDPERQAGEIDALDGEINAILTWNGGGWIVEDMQLAGVGGTILDDNGNPIDDGIGGSSDGGQG